MEEFRRMSLDELSPEESSEIEEEDYLKTHFGDKRVFKSEWTRNVSKPNTFRANEAHGSKPTRRALHQKNRPVATPFLLSTDASQIVDDDDDEDDDDDGNDVFNDGGDKENSPFNSHWSSVDRESRFSHPINRKESSIVDDLLCEIYDRCQPSRPKYSVDSDGYTEYSSTSEGAYHSSRGDGFNSTTPRLSRAALANKDVDELREMLQHLKNRVGVMSGRLIKELKRRDKNLAKLTKNQDVITAILQAVSQKRRVDTRIRFSIRPRSGKRAFRQWYDALRAVSRLPNGIPQNIRKEVWLSLADRHIRHLKIDWKKTVRFAFNDRSNPDDDALGIQIVKDLHRTGCSGFCGQGAEEDRVVLKRVLLAYARWNKSVGYCQGFNVIAALILGVVDRVEDDALKVMIFLIDHVLPDSYFANNLRALSVDMAVFRELLRFKLPELSRHLDQLQKADHDPATGCYEPPLTNVFTMQWFLTLFATCLPQSLVLRIWDCIFLEGSEVLLRVALAIWAKLGPQIEENNTADEFYTTMGMMSQKMLHDSYMNADDLIQTIYSIAPFPFPHLSEIREKYMFSITPFSPEGSLAKTSEDEKDRGKPTSHSDEEAEKDDEDLANITCFTSIFPVPIVPPKSKIDQGESANLPAADSNDITQASPGAFGSNNEIQSSQLSTAMLERMTMDIHALKRQYSRIQRRQQQAHVIYGPGSRPAQQRGKTGGSKTMLTAKIESPAAMNHLFVDNEGLGLKNMKVTVGPHISPALTLDDDIDSPHSSRKISAFKGLDRRLARGRSNLSQHSLTSHKDFGSGSTLTSMNDDDKLSVTTSGSSMDCNRSLNSDVSTETMMAEAEEIEGEVLESSAEETGDHVTEWLIDFGVEDRGKENSDKSENHGEENGNKDQEDDKDEDKQLEEKVKKKEKNTYDKEDNDGANDVVTSGELDESRATENGENISEKTNIKKDQATGKSEPDIEPIPSKCNLSIVSGKDVSNGTQEQSETNTCLTKRNENSNDSLDSNHNMNNCSINQDHTHHQGPVSSHPFETKVTSKPPLSRTSSLERPSPPITPDASNVAFNVSTMGFQPQLVDTPQASKPHRIRPRSSSNCSQRSNSSSHSGDSLDGDAQVQKSPEFYPFPTRKTKHVVQRTKNGLKVGLYLPVHDNNEPKKSQVSKCLSRELNAHLRHIVGSKS
ncbi:uncharacterized protein LOC117107863 isoform X2 [Anneissia japonica]|uniref:uncharacterized protein LOC117107863 isoform X2 n=1 Tax=Anneissia japonica TaxID=1529436 RepID=UPI0014256BA4|nr:uncharacterized protein LOC117107863 isoform X2 [Anneissia japonica]